jgi:hypothetical protein
VVEHLLSLALQNIPTSSKQSTLPHLHDAEPLFSLTPCSHAQEGDELHVLEPP